jgi:hypothetical protein
MIEFLNSNKELISTFSNITTILAFFIAIWAFLRWKKEQKYSKQLEYIMEFEDRFEILMRDIKIEYKWFSDLDNNLIDAEKQSQEYKIELNQLIKDEYEKYKITQTIDESFYQYSLSLTRAKRFFKDIEKECETLDYDYLKELSLERIKLNPKWKDKKAISRKAKKHLKKITTIHEKGLTCIKKYYT